MSAMPFVTYAQTASNTTSPTPRLKIGLALSGGGARGAAHIGVIKVLERLHIPIDFIAGSSMGALVGAAYASGMPIDDIDKAVSNADWDDLLTDVSPRADRSYARKEEDQARLLKLEVGVSRDGLLLPAGAISGQKLDIFFSELTRNYPAAIGFNSLPIPFRAIATNAETGQMVVFDAGKLTDVMHASMSVPGAVSPYEIGDKLYFDGGLTRNLPVDVVRLMGADIVIAVSLGTPLLKRSELKSIVGISEQMINILTEQNVKASLDSLKPVDILISPTLDNISSTDFSLVKIAIAAGENSTQAQGDKLQSLAINATNFSAMQTSRAAMIKRPAIESETIDEIRISGNVRVSRSEIGQALEVKVGDKADYAQINAGVSRVYGLGYFERVNYSLLNVNNRQILNLDAREKQWGPDYLRFGLSMSADSVGEGRFNLIVRYLQTQVNTAGAEWRSDLQIGRDRRLATQLLQPFAASSPFNVSVGAEITRRPIDIFDTGHRVAQYDVYSNVFDADLGFDLTRNSIARLGFIRGNSRATINIGSALPDFRNKQGGFRFQTIYDNLNDPNFPTSGRSLHIDYFASSSTLAASENYRKIEINFSDQHTFGVDTFSIAGRYGRGFGGQLPVFEQFSLGGFQQLSGYQPGELIGRTVALGRFSYFRKLVDFKNPFGKSIYAGFSVEVGRVASNLQLLSKSDTKNSVGIYAGFDTFLGPLYLGLGHSQQHDTLLYFFLGQP